MAMKNVLQPLLYLTLVEHRHQRQGEEASEECSTFLDFDKTQSLNSICGEERIIRRSLGRPFRRVQNPTLSALIELRQS